MDVLKQFTPLVEVYSIDEAFLQFEGFEHYDLEAYAQQMQKRVRKWTGCLSVLDLVRVRFWQRSQIEWLKIYRSNQRSLCDRF